MQLVHLSEDARRAALAALAAVASEEGRVPLSESDRAVIDAVAVHLLDAPAPSNRDEGSSLPRDLAHILPSAEARQLLVVAASVLCFADIEVDEHGKKPPTARISDERVALVGEIATQFGITDKDVRDLHGLTKRHRDLVEMDLFRRFNANAAGPQANLRRVATSTVEESLRVHRREHLERWRALEQLAPGTLGSELVRYYHDNGWDYPGTEGKQPIDFVSHDFHHVLGGYPTTVSGELQVGAFTAGASERPLDAALFFLMWEQLGVGGSQIAGAVGKFEPEAFMAALERGARSSQEFTEGKWDPWSLVERNLEEVRSSYHIEGQGPVVSPGPWNADPGPAPG